MKRKEAIETIKMELGEKATDKRTKVGKAVQVLDDWLKWDEAKIEQIIDETIEEFEEGAKNDFVD